MIRQVCLGAVLLAAATTSSAATNRPEGYVTICRIPQTCSVSAPTNVAFGASGQFVYKVADGSFTCTVETFGSDPLPSKDVKECSIPADGSSPPTDPPPSSGITLGATAGDGQVSLSWSYSNVTPGNQEVYRDTDSDPNGRSRIASLSSSARSFTATGLTNGTTCWFWIKNTVNGVVTNSNGASATPSGAGRIRHPRPATSRDLRAPPMASSSQ